MNVASRFSKNAATVIATLFTEGTHTVVTDTARVDGARNLPVPDVAGGPEIFWRDGDEVWVQAHDGPRRCGERHELSSSAPLPPPEGGALVVLDHPVAGVDELAAALTR